MPTQLPLVARKIRAVRQMAGLTRRQVARVAGITLSFIEKIELGYRRPSRETLEAIAEALGVSGYFLGRGIAEQPPRDRPQDALAKVVRRARDIAGLSRQELADAVGIRACYLEDIEIGRRLPSRARLRVLASALGLADVKLVRAASKWQPPPIAATVRQLRLEASLSRSAVAAAAGISPNYLALIERGLATPTVETINGLAAALWVDPAVLLERVDAPVKHRARTKAERRHPR